MTYERRRIIGVFYINGQRIVKGPYSCAYRGKKVSRKLVKQVPLGYLDFFILDANGNKVRRRLGKEEFQKKVVFNSNSE